MSRNTRQATVISQVGVQLSLAFGVALGGGVLEASHLITGGEGINPSLFDFHMAFWVVGTVALVSTAIFWRLPKHAGKEISGHGAEPAAGE